MSYKHTKRWRLKHPDKRYADKEIYYQKFRTSRNTGDRWTIRDIEMIMDKSLSDRELHHLIGRGVAAIQTMRSIIKRRDKIDAGISPTPSKSNK